MKIFKDKEISFFPRPMLLHGKPHLSLGALLFWDLTSPDSLLDEQALWKTVPSQLGDPPVLDQGMPKQAGEYLLYGDCCAPEDQSFDAAEVDVRVGELRKKLYVFGDRHWTMDHQASKPQPFSRMPLTWQRAFGGPGFERNPVGKGFLKDAEKHADAPLPNVELPNDLMASPSDTPEPASLQAWDMTWPQRNSQSGTFDDHWKQQRWPGLPDDFDYGSFNAAPQDQRMQGFFSGDESIAIDNMHPQYTNLRSSLPGRRVRCFLTLRKGFKRFEDPQQFEQVFQEVPLHAETVWLFPNVLRGVCLYRGVCEVADEDYADVVRVYLAQEPLAEAPKSLEHYREQQQKALNRSVPIDMAPFEAAREKVAVAVRNMKNMPKEAARARKMAMGQLPVMPREPEELGQSFQGGVAGRMQTLDSLERMAEDMKSRFGHKAKVDMGVFQKTRGKLQALGQKIDAKTAKLSKVKEKALSKKAAMLQKNKHFLQTHLTSEQLEKSGMNPDALLGEKPRDLWQEAGFAFVVRCRRNLEHDSELQERLAHMGLERKTIRRAWLGMHAGSQEENAEHWGIEAKHPDLDQQGRFTIPAGLVLPRFDGPELKRILLRPPDPGTGDAENPGRYLLGHGESLVPAPEDKSMPPLFLPAAEDSQEQPAPVAIVADELQALYVEQEAGDFCHVLALKNAQHKPDKEGGEVLKAAKHVLVVLPAGEDQNSARFAPWQKTVTTAVAVPLPKGSTVFEARAANVDVRQTLLDALPPEFAKAQALAPELPETGAPPKNMDFAFPFPKMDVGSLVTGTMQAVRSKHQPKIDTAKAERAESMAQIKKHFAPQGLDPEEALKKAAASPRQSYKEMGDEMADHILAKREAYKAAGRLPADKDQELLRQAQKIRDIAGKSQARADSQKARFAELSQKADSLKAAALSHTLPGKAGGEMQEQGLTPSAMRPLTREQVIERYKAGLDFRKKILKGVDCSKLDLKGIDLRKAMVDKCNFSGANLQNAQFDGALLRNSDLSEASLTGAHMLGTLFSKVKLPRATLREAKCRRVILRECELEAADLSGASLRMLQAEKCKLDKTDFADADLSLSVFSSCQMDGAIFNNASLRKVILRDCSLDDALFVKAALPQTGFQGAKGERVSFIDANMDKCRIISGCRFPGARFDHARMKHAFFRESELPDAIFTQANLDDATFEGCILHRADLKRISAKKARFIKCDLEAASLLATNMAMGSFRMSRLVQADLSGANLFAVDFYKAILGHTQFHLANLERTLLLHRTELFE